MRQGYSARVIGGQDYPCGRELWVRATPAECGASMVRLAGLGQSSPGDQISTAMLMLVGTSALAGAAQGAIIGTIAAGKGRRGRGAGYGALAGAIMNAIVMGVVAAPIIAKSQQGA